MGLDCVSGSTSRTGECSASGALDVVWVGVAVAREVVDKTEEVGLTNVDFGTILTTD